MKKFTLTAEVTISIYTTVEAENLDEAKKIGYDRPIEAARYGHSTEQAKEVWVSDEYDGSPCRMIKSLKI